MLTVNELVSATNGNLLNGSGDKKIKRYSIDSREVDNETWFIPIIGEKTDAHEYIVECVKTGVVGTYINSNHKNKKEIIAQAISNNKEICIIEVDDTKEALNESAIYNRNKHSNIPVIAVTGSVGKTSTREMIATILSEKFNILKTIKNYNSDIGFPLMLLMIEAQDICVFEMGMDSLGQLERLSNMAKPSIAVITNIGTAHIGLLGNKENIFKAKMEITSGLVEGGILIINGDDEYLSNVENSNKYNVIKYRVSDTGNIKNIMINEDSSTFELNDNGKLYEIKINEPGKHQIYNVLAGINVAKSLKMDMDSIIRGISKFRNFSKRMEKIIIGDNITLIDDSYNASYDSMKSGLDVFETMQYNRKIVVLGDMFELGEYSKELHENVGKYLNNKKFDIVITCGDDAKYIYNEIDKTSKEVLYFNTKELATKFIISNMKSNDAIYFKAANGMKFIDIINKIKEYIG